MDFQGLLNGLKNYFVPPAPPAPTPMQQGQNVSSFPGYQAPQAPPPQVDMNALGALLSGAGSQLSNFLGGLIPSAHSSFNYTPQPSTTPVIPDVAPVAGGGVSVSPSPAPDNLEAIIRKGFAAYGNPPIATLSAELAQAGQGLPDPLLPAIVSLKESSGGRNQTHANNPLNVLDPRGFDYPTPDSSITGQHGDNRWSFQELLNESPNYSRYRQTGDLADFFSKYTPPGGTNASIADQVALYNKLKSQYFTQ